MASNDSRRRFSAPKLLGLALMFSVVMVGIQFQKQLRQPLLFSSSGNPNIDYVMMEATALLFGRNETNNGGPHESTNQNTILVSNVFTNKVLADQPKKTTRKQRNIFFIHVGKTGGTTLRETVLRFGCRLYGNDKARSRCLNFLKAHGGESVLGQRTTGIFHFQQKHPKTRRQIYKMDWMFVIREPISRFMSSFEYINPHNCIQGKKERNMEQKCNRQLQARNLPGSFPSKFFYDCFPTIQEFLNFEPPVVVSSGKKTKAKGAGVDPRQQKCYQLWKEAFAPGLSQDYGHMTANYQYYSKGLKLSGDGRNVFVIRTEHLWNDVSTIDTMVGGSGNFSHVQGKVVNKQTRSARESKQSTNSTTVNATTIASNSKQVKLVPLPFCCALLSDMLAYRNIVNRADNLKEEEKLETNAKSWTRCNATSWEDLQSKCGTSATKKKKKKKKKGMK